MRLKTEQVAKFNMPGTSIKDIPLQVDGQRLSIGFVEVGCKKGKNVGALKGKRELFYKLWGDVYRKQHGITWNPEVYRILGHFEQWQYTVRPTDRHTVDAIISVEEITRDMIRNLSERDLNSLYKRIKGPKSIETLECVLHNVDSDYIFTCISQKGHDSAYSSVRGYMAETLFQNSIYRAKPESMKMFRNGDFRYTNKRYDNGTEIDAILVFHGEEPIKELISNLEEEDYLRLSKHIKW